MSPLLKKAALAALIAIVFMATIVLVGSPPASRNDDDDGPGWGLPVDGLQAGLVAKVPKAAHQADIELLGMLRNVGRKPIRIDRRTASLGNCSLGLRDASGKIVQAACSRPKWPNPVPLGENVLMPGDAIGFRFDLHLYAPCLTVGEYTVVFTDGEVSSAAVAVEILPAPPGTPAKAPALAIFVDKEGRYSVDGQLASLEDIGRRLAEANLRAGMDTDGNSRLRVLVGADSQVAYKYVQRVFLECMKQKVWRTDFGVSDTAPQPARKWRVTESE